MQAKLRCTRTQNYPRVSAATLQRHLPTQDPVLSSITTLQLTKRTNISRNERDSCTHHQPNSSKAQPMPSIDLKSASTSPFKKQLQMQLSLHSRHRITPFSHGPKLIDCIDRHNALSDLITQPRGNAAERPSAVENAIVLRDKFDVRKCHQNLNSSRIQVFTAVVFGDRTERALQMYRRQSRKCSFAMAALSWSTASFFLSMQKQCTLKPEQHVFVAP